MKLARRHIPQVRTIDSVWYVVIASIVCDCFHSCKLVVHVQNHIAGVEKRRCVLLLGREEEGPGTRHKCPVIGDRLVIIGVEVWHKFVLFLVDGGILRQIPLAAILQVGVACACYMYAHIDRRKCVVVFLPRALAVAFVSLSGEISAAQKLVDALC